MNRRRTAYEAVLEPNSSPLRNTPGRTRTCGVASTSGRCRRRWATGVTNDDLRRQRPVRDSNPSNLRDKQAATPAASQGGGRVSGGSRTRLSDSASRCLGCSATDTRSCPGRIRTRNRLVNSEPLYRWSYRAGDQSGRPDSNRRSPAPRAGGLPGFPTSCSSKIALSRSKLKSKRRRQESNLLRIGLQPTALPSSPGVTLEWVVQESNLPTGFRRPSTRSARRPRAPHARVELASRPSDGRSLDPQDRAKTLTRCSGGFEPTASTFTGSHARR